MRYSLVVLGCLVPAVWGAPAIAQSITPALDGTGTVVQQTGGAYTIQGGQWSGDRANQFHSFDRFGLNPNESATFIATPTLQNILGRVVGGNPSIINGLLQVIGGSPNLYLMNPAGIVFGANASLNVPAAFTATTATGIGFQNGQWFHAMGDSNYATLTGTPHTVAFALSQPGAIANLGNLAVSPGQSLTLIGGTVLNTGTLTAPGGQITIAAVPGQNRVRLSQPGSLLSLEVTPQSAAPTPLPFTPPTLPQLLTGGNLTSATGVTVNADGTLQLNGSTVQAQPGSAIASGQMSVASPASPGQIAILGDRVSLQSVTLDASGPNGGTVRIGGDYLGQGSVPNARFTSVDANSVIRADAMTSGNGGRVIVWADDTTNFAGTITARGGGSGGNGGFVETSGKQTLTVAPTAMVNTTAPNGIAGTWVLDPTAMTIVPAGGIDTTIAAANANPGISTIDFSVVNTALGLGNVALTATNFITVDAGTALTIPGASVLTLNAPTINLNAAIVTPLATSLQGTAAVANVGGGGTVQNGVDVVAAGGTVNLAAATYTLANTVNITRSVTVNGVAQASTIVSGNNAVQVFNVSGAGAVANLNNLTVTQGNAGNGGGIFVNPNSNLTITNSTISGNSAQGGLGGGIFNNGGNLTIVNSTVEGNRAVGANGTNGSLLGAGGGGGGGAGLGGALYSTTGIVTIRSSTFVSNQAIGGNGGQGFPNNGSFDGDGGSGGGPNSGIGGTPGIAGGPGGFASGGGGGGGSAFVGGAGGLGGFGGGGGGGGGRTGGGSGFPGGISNFGGGVGGQGAASAAGGGGGGAGLGGAVFANGGTVNVTDTTFNGNSSTGGTRGTSGFFAPGSSNGQGMGGAIFANTGATINLNNATLSGNLATNQGGGIYNNGNTLAIANSLVAGNTAPTGQEIFSNPPTTSGGNNLFGVSGNVGLVGVTQVASDIVPTVPLNQILAPLGNYGGPTQTMALVPGSPAINRAGAGATITDQRGVATVGVRDIGAYESAGFVLAAISGGNQSTTISTPFLSPLVVGITEAAFNRPVMFAGITIQFVAPTSGASAILSSTTVTTDANGQAGVLPTANDTPGRYAIAARLLGAPDVVFALSNEALLLPPSQPELLPEQEAQIARAIRQDPTSPGDQPVIPTVPIVSITATNADTIFASTEDNLTTQFTAYLELPEKPQAKTLGASQAALRQIAAASGVEPAILYVLLAPQSGGQQLSQQCTTTSPDEPCERTKPALFRDPVTGSPMIRQIPDTDTDLQLLLVTPTGDSVVKVVPGVSRAAILQTARTFRNEVADPSKQRTRSYLKPAQQLYQWIIEPITPELKARNIGTIAFIMDTPLRFLPLAALHDGKQFLVEQYSLSLMPSLNLSNEYYGDIRSARVLGAGAATFTRFEQNPLPAVQAEITTILSAKDRWQGNTLLNDNFTVENLENARRNQPFGIIHLATHGEFLPGRINQSYIQFADRQLHLNQIRNLGWNNPPAELVVLSACRMAVGNEEAELGFAGFAVKAGVKSVLASLWNVSDEGTMGLMVEFYQQLWQVPLKAEALRQAQIAMLRGTVRVQDGQLQWSGGTTPLPPELADLNIQSFSHPYFWSAFTMVGSPW